MLSQNSVSSSQSQFSKSRFSFSLALVLTIVGAPKMAGQVDLGWSFFENGLYSCEHDQLKAHFTWAKLSLKAIKALLSAQSG